MRSNHLLQAALLPLALAAWPSPNACLPNVQNPTDTVAPCDMVNIIQEVCLTNGTTPLDFKAEQECICGGSYFAEHSACLTCQSIHGYDWGPNINFRSSVYNSASRAFCDVPTPTAEIRSIMVSILSTMSPPTHSPTHTRSDQYPGQTAVSLYFTPSPGMSRGPGQITGDAARATASGLLTAPASSTTTAISTSSSSDSGVIYLTGTRVPGSTPSDSVSPSPNGGVSLLKRAGGVFGLAAAVLLL
ncbi:hypothetical protein QBC46DRAFT_370154 [Diplogelasinospora grovesii]|uniref:Collagen-like protein Mcl1 n=1 Tax=Diplogelasinospora grovesii TaxID=303347 RepID=A0AAN6NJB1_9PEZI|nr:hypothetical protein QBC46DRAFT_370154 [Diplogelasinospora grovesii]